MTKGLAAATAAATNTTEKKLVFTNPFVTTLTVTIPGDVPATKPANKTALIAGAVAGGILLIAGVAVAVFFMLKAKNRGGGARTANVLPLQTAVRQQ